MGLILPQLRIPTTPIPGWSRQEPSVSQLDPAVPHRGRRGGRCPRQRQGHRWPFGRSGNYQKLPGMCSVFIWDFPNNAKWCCVLWTFWHASGRFIFRHVLFWFACFCVLFSHKHQRVDNKKKIIISHTLGVY